MSKRWGVLCLAGCLGLVLGLASIGSSSVYAGEGKKLAVEGAVFDLNSSSSLSIYGYVSDEVNHPVAGAQIAAKPKKGDVLKATSGEDGGYRIEGIETNTTYTVTATAKNKEPGKKINIKVLKEDTLDFIANFKLKPKPK